MTNDPITKKTYLKVYAGLMLLLAATVAMNFVNIEPFNIAVTLAIAFAKALLVLLFFMHVRYSPRLIWIYAALGVIWISFLMGGTLMDVLARTAVGLPPG